jgi:hypothetical protein
MTSDTDRGRPGTRVKAAGRQSVQVGDHNVQENESIGRHVRTSVRTQRTSIAWPVRVSDVPRRHPTLRGRIAPLAALARSGPGIPVAFTRMHAETTRSLRLLEEY